ncbi:hypothetical protein HDE76_000023 [Rhodanobacter sp. ANJX3]|uniref:hypothetical protein n=1 Tax=Rhodanobacter sp. ANJX3 TaxID=2723083 RepID=UPI00160E6C61|nr:hypothetical protein [Rhodanobacter sp. ANJX3]MBB5356841.1 hypothetical protein [Rhodanobacter sp. ANJX3]
MMTKTSREAPQHWGARLIASIALLPLITALLYLNGWAYHEGYLDYFHLPSSMFPLDLQETLVHGVAAWLNGAAAALTWMIHSVVQHWFLVILTILFITSIGPFRRWFLTFVRRKRPPTFAAKWHLPVWMRKLAWQLIRAVSVSYLVFYIPFTILSLLVIGLLVLVAPFQSVGRGIAAKDAATNFAASPEAFLTAPDGVRRSLRVMSCEGPFCALYTEGHAVIVPRDSVTWATSPMAGGITSKAK